MEVFLFQMRREKGNYTALVRDGRLYRKEGDKVGEWLFYGGAIRGIDFIQEENWSLDDRYMGTKPVEGLGENRGKPLKDIARLPVRVGDCLIATPIHSVRAERNEIKPGESATLSGVVESITPREDTPSFLSYLVTQ